jgi:hypothetical protein
MDLIVIMVIVMLLLTFVPQYKRVPDYRCPRCEAFLPRLRQATSWRQMLWGGWTCRGCGCEVNRRGRKNES